MTVQGNSESIRFKRDKNSCFLKGWSEDVIESVMSSTIHSDNTARNGGWGKNNSFRLRSPTLVGRRCLSAKAVPRSRSRFGRKVVLVIGGKLSGLKFIHADSSWENHGRSWSYRFTENEWTWQVYRGKQLLFHMISMVFHMFSVGFSGSALVAHHQQCGRSGDASVWKRYGG